MLLCWEEKTQNIHEIKYIYFGETITLLVIFIYFALFMTDVENDIEIFMITLP